MKSDFVFGDFAKIDSGFAFKSSEWISDGIPVVKIKNIKDGMVSLEDCAYISEVSAERARGYKAEGGEILISLTGYVGQVGRVLPKDSVYVNQRVGFVRPKDSKETHYVYYLLRFLRTQIEELGTGTAQANVAPKDIMKISIPTISAESRVLVGNLLSYFDQKILVNNSLSNTLENIAQAIFKSWFIDFDPVEAKMAGEKPEGMDEATAALFPDEMEESELGPVPKGWVVRSLFDCGLEIESGSRPKGGVKGFTSGVPSIGAESINGLGVFDFSKTKYIPRDFYDKMKKGKPKDFDVLLYKDGGKPGEFKPRVGMFGLGFPFSEFAINEHVFILRAPDLGEPFLYFWIRLERTLEILRNRGVKAAIPGINQQDVGTLLVIQPSQEVLKAFNKMVMTSISMILTSANESLSLTNLRDALLPRLISGELQIPEEMLIS